MISLIAALAVKAGAATAAPCGDVPVCPPTYPREAQGLQNEYRSSISTPEQRAKMIELIEQRTTNGKTDWAAVSSAYYEWLNNLPAPKNVAAEQAVDALERGRALQYQYQVAAEDAVRRRLIDPQSAQFEWPFGFVDGWWKPFLGKKRVGWVTCGFVNSRNRLGGYVGRSAFAVVIDKESREANWVEIADATKSIDFTTLGCQKMAKSLPVAIARAPRPEGTGGTLAAPLSVADEIAKLGKLRDQGLLTEAEFQAQKAKLLDRR